MRFTQTIRAMQQKRLAFCVLGSKKFVRLLAKPSVRPNDVLVSPRVNPLFVRVEVESIDGMSMKFQHQEAESSHLW
jgi:hypothetical protein